MPNTTDTEYYRILDEIDAAIHPDKMEWIDAVSFLEGLESDIKARIEALQEENED